MLLSSCRASPFTLGPNKRRVLQASVVASSSPFRDNVCTTSVGDVDSSATQCFPEAPVIRHMRHRVTSMKQPTSRPFKPPKHAARRPPFPRIYEALNSSKQQKGDAYGLIDAVLVCLPGMQSKAEEVGLGESASCTLDGSEHISGHVHNVYHSSAFSTKAPSPRWPRRASSPEVNPSCLHVSNPPGVLPCSTAPESMRKPCASMSIFGPPRVPGHSQ